MIDQRKLSLISNRSVINSRKRVSEIIIEKDYCISWFLIGLANNCLKDSLIFKGGTALRRCYFQEYRFSEDLDFTLIEEISLSKIIENLVESFAFIKRETGIVFEIAHQEPSTDSTHTFYASYIGPLPGGPKQIKIDITNKEILLSPLNMKALIKTYPEYSDFPPNIEIKVYSLEEIVIEKTCALLSMFRNEPRDLFDLDYLLNVEGITVVHLEDLVEKKLGYKGIELNSIREQYDKKENRLKMLWEKRLSQQMSDLPEFESVYRNVRRKLRQSGVI